MQDVVIEHEFKMDFLDFEPEWWGFNQFPMETELDDYSFKAKQMVYMLNEVYQGTKRELKGFFDLNEARLIVNAFNGHLYSPELPNKIVLVANVEDDIQINVADEIFGVDVDKLLKKLNQLSEFQAFTVIRMAYEFLYSRYREAIDTDNQNGKLLSAIFNVKDEER
ncbi:hypothetical protein D0S48_13660 [Psychrobacillus sp. AK 1817]|uniref:hypothetical protein n=1 Tax=Psychrobacillus sp. AK 1817 TaxID=2303505 RepID=UPI0012475FD0|nr:hypothetical protein [Psychrobacillus sp. AK 1817]QEY21629.1 hypothetical protein D0S48_13660 [Psychrobacillus sp. AK 1817]